MPNKSATQRVIKLAIEGGYKPLYEYNCQYCESVWPEKAPLNYEKILLDPLFWQALEKALEWEDDPTICPVPPCKMYWHSFIDHLASNKDPNSFFADLIKNL